MFSEPCQGIVPGVDGECIWRVAEAGCQFHADGRGVCGMIDASRERVLDGGCGREHVRGVRFQQNPVAGESAEDIECLVLLLMEKIPGCGKIRTHRQESASGFQRSAEGMQEKVCRRWFLGEAVEEVTPCLEAVDGDGAFHFACDAQMIEKYGSLDRQVRRVDP